MGIATPQRLKRTKENFHFTNMFELCTGSHQSWKYLFPGARSALPEVSLHWCRYTLFSFHEPCPSQTDFPFLFWKGLDFGFSLLGLLLTPSFPNTRGVGIYCYNRILLFPKAESPGYTQCLLEDIPEIKIPTKRTLILLPNTPTAISATQPDHGIRTLTVSLAKTKKCNSTLAKHP